MAISAGDILRVVLEYAFPGAGTALNVFHYIYSGGDVDETTVMDAIVEWAENEWGATWAGMASSTATLEGVRVEEVNVAGELLRDVGAELIGIVGTNGADVMPAAVSAYVQGYTNVPQVFGRKYVPGISEASIDNGTFTAGQLAQLALLLLDYIDEINVGTGQNLFPGVLSKRENAFKSFTNVGLFNNLPAYQRRRKSGVGI